MADVEWGTGEPGAPLASARSASVAAAARLLQPKHRRQEQRFLAEGPQVVREVLAAGMAERLFVTADAGRAFPEFLTSARTFGIPVTWCDRDAIKRLATATTPVGVVALCHMPQPSTEQALRGAQLAVALWQANDPGNVGTIIRTADALGADAVLLTADSVDPFNDKCVRSTAGSIAHIPVVTGVDFDSLRAQAARAGLKVVATAMHGQALDAPESVALLAKPVLWLFGSEAHGLPEQVCADADAVISIPMQGHAESLNVAVAAGVCLYASSVAQRNART